MASILLLNHWIVFLLSTKSMALASFCFRGRWYPAAEQHFILTWCCHTICHTTIFKVHTLTVLLLLGATKYDDELRCICCVIRGNTIVPKKHFFSFFFYFFLMMEHIKGRALNSLDDYHDGCWAMPIPAAAGSGLFIA